jgi:CheY-like chemotaxis protein
MMIVMDGLTAIREIRQRELSGKLTRQYVIALTGNAREAQIEQAMEAGMDAGRSCSTLFDGRMLMCGWG